jgi:hypothetical protein
MRIAYPSARAGDMDTIYIDQMIACAAILIAVIILNCLPKDVRRAMFVVMSGAGMLAAVAGFANAALAG